MSIEVNEKDPQQMAIESYKTPGNYLIIAGPGTGKTYTITKRIEAMLSSGISQDKILCLTFSNTASTNMKLAIEKAFAEANKEKPDISIYTFHSFCLDIIKKYPKRFNMSDNINIISYSKQQMLLKECIDEYQLSHKETAFATEKNCTYYYIKEILERFAEIKKYRLTPEQYEYNLDNNPDWIPSLTNMQNKLQEKIASNNTKTKTLEENIQKLELKIKKAKETLELYKLYEAKRKRANLVDFSDMVIMILDEFDRDEQFLNEIAQNYEYIMVDEYQDTNSSQNQIIFKLAKANTPNKEKRNVFVVGDDDQIIYTFQGAKLTTLKDFIKEFDLPSENVICFKNNYRSTKKVLDFARKIVLQDDLMLEKDESFKQYNISKKLTRKNDELIPFEKDVRCLIYRDSLQERVNIVEEIEQLINSEDCPKDDDGNKNLSQIAVLAKTNEELVQYADLLYAKNIPYVLSKGKNIFDIPSVNVMISYMQFLMNHKFYYDKILRLMLSGPFAIHQDDYKYFYDTKSRYDSIIDNMKQLKENNYVYETLDRDGNPQKNTIKNTDVIEDILNTFYELVSEINGKTPKETLLCIGNRTKIFDYFFNRNKVARSENIAGLKTLIEEAEAFSKVNTPKVFADFMVYLERAINNGIKIYTDIPPVKQNAVQLSTYHGSKGMEYEYVYMPYLIEKKLNMDSPIIPLSIEDDITFDNITGKKIDETYEDQLKKSDLIKRIYVAITRAKYTLRLSYTKVKDDGKPAEPLYLLNNEKIKELIEHVEYKNENDTEEETYEKEIMQTLLYKNKDHEQEYNSFINDVLAKKSFSVTALNTYLACGREYLYKTIYSLYSNLDDKDYANYGSAVHKAFEETIRNKIEKGKYLSEPEFIHTFEKTLMSLPMSSKKALKNMLNKGANMLQTKLKESKDDKEGKSCYKYLIDTKDEHFAVEYNFDFEIDGHQFTGKIDRIDKQYKDQSENPDKIDLKDKYILYDYKTSKYDDRNQIAIGKKHEDYYNQMALYKHFLTMKLKCGYDDIRTMFIFPSNYNTPHEIYISKEQCLDVLEKYRKAIQDIKAHKFEPLYDVSKCDEYCPFKDGFCTLLKKMI